MGKKTLSANLVGTSGTNYDLDEITQDSRSNGSKELVVQVWRYNPKSKDQEKITPNPKTLKVGQIWMSVKDDGIE